jgi:hypothetical protein
MVRQHMVFWVAAGAGAVALAIVLAALAFGGGSATTGHPQAIAPPTRTVVVSFGKEKLSPALAARDCGPRPGCANGQARLSLVRFVGGDRPPANGLAKVLTDTNCDPDAYGISHCLNTLRLPDGHSLVVRHSHDMHMFPCLAPGDTVELFTVAGFAAA